MNTIWPPPAMCTAESDAECIFPLPRRFFTWRQLSDKQFDVSIIKLLLSHVLAFENVSAGRSSQRAYFHHRFVAFGCTDPS